jgi:hypothetical protein
VLGVERTHWLPGRWRWLLPLLIIGVVAAQAGAIAVSRWVDGLRQPHIATDLPTVDTAIANTVTAAGEQAAVAVGGLVRASTCALDPLTQGGRYTRTADLYLSPGNEDRLITGIAQRLPADYHPSREGAIAGGAAPLLAAAGHGVSLSVRQLGNGWVAAIASTGCTSGGQPVDRAPAPADPAVSAVTDLLAGLHTRPTRLSEEGLPCPGGQIATVSTVSQPTTAGNLADRLTAPAGSTAFDAAGANRVAYRQGGTSVIVAASDDNTAVTVERTTVSC